MSKWTIGMVNYYSSVYIEWQLKILFEFNSESDFKLIIVDNSQNEEEFKRLTQLCSNPKYKQKVNIIKHNPVDKSASGQHGEGLDIIKDKAESEYLVTQDPDFFWLKKDYLKWLDYLMKYNDAVGIPYPYKVIEGQEHFPGSFGCVYKLSKIKNLSFKPYINNDISFSWQKFNEILSKKKDKKYDFSYDVGWQIRKKLSKDNDRNFISFSQKNIFNYLGEKLKNKTPYSFETNSKIYYHNNKIIGLHLFRGTFTGKVKKHMDSINKLTKDLVSIRNQIGRFAYNQIANNNCDLKSINFSPKISIVSLFYLLLYKLKSNNLTKHIIPIKSKNIKNKVFMFRLIK
jgi:hypothetical protein